VRKRALLITGVPSFRDGSQRANTCRRLLDLVDAADRWTPTGPAPEARAALDRAAGPDAQRILAACWAIWEGSSTLGVNELLLLEPQRLEAVGELLAAIARGAAAIDAWLARWECSDPPRRAVVREHPSVASRQRQGA
jgi:hypothetical protein